MPTFNIGDQVKILPPFAVSFPTTYPVIAIAAAANTYTVDIYGDGIGSDFSAIYLEAA